jgi:hypothetical protein
MDHPAIDHIEKTLGDSYRKEIDQEENVWRSLPFFAATIALELTALFQLLTKLPVAGTWAAVGVEGLLAVTGLLLTAALVLLAACIAPVRFRYLSKEPLLLRYTEDLIAAEQAPENQSYAEPLKALPSLKLELARQYSVATDHNRRINKRREPHRAVAGLCVVGSVLMILLLVAVTLVYHVPDDTIVYHVPDDTITGDVHGPAQAVTAPGQSAGGASASAGGAAPASDPAHPASPTDANHH